MELRIDDAFLDSLGLGNISEDKKRVFVQQILETLELRIGTRLSENLTDAQLDDFERVTSQAEGDPGEASLEWLKRNHPDYEMIVAEEFEKLKQELRLGLNNVMSASNL